MEAFLPISQKDMLQTLGVTAGTVKGLVDKGLITLEDIEVFRDPYRGRHFTPSTPLALTPERQAVYRDIVHKLDERKHGVFLLHG